MNKDIYVKQKNKEEGNELFLWCKNNNLPLNNSNFSYVEGKWIYFKWRDGGFCNNDELQESLKAVTIEEFKRIQLQDVFKVGKYYKFHWCNQWDIVAAKCSSVLSSHITFNGWYNLSQNKLYPQSMTIDLGEVTQISEQIPEEIINYLPKLKSQWEIGKWCEFRANGLVNIAKVKTYEKEHLTTDDWILYKSFGACPSYAWSKPEFIRELKVEDPCIQDYLPKGHIDKISVVPEYVECISVPGGWGDNTKKGSIYKTSAYCTKTYRILYSTGGGQTCVGQEHNFKPSTKEAFDAQNKSAEIKPKFTLKNTKIWLENNPDLCKQVQEKAFKLGFVWGGIRKELSHLNCQSLHFWGDNEICYSNSDRTDFNGTSKTEIFFEDLGIIPTPPQSGIVSCLPEYAETGFIWEQSNQGVITTTAPKEIIKYVIGIDPYKTESFEKEFLSKDFNKPLQLNIKQTLKTQLKLKL